MLSNGLDWMAGAQVSSVNGRRLIVIYEQSPLELWRAVPAGKTKKQLSLLSVPTHISSV